MTAQEAFAIAFDEAVVMDAAPSIGNLSGGGPKNLGAASAGKMKDAAAAEGAKSSMGPKKSLAEHKQEGCDAEKNGHPERCPYVQSIARDLEKSQGLDHATALAQAIQLHSGGGMNTQAVGSAKAQQPMANQPQPQEAKQGQIQPESGQQPQAPTPVLQPKEAEAKIQTLVGNPSSIPDAPAEAIEPQVINGMEVKTVAAAAAATVLSEAADDGNVKAEKEINKVEEQLEQAKATESQQGELTPEDGGSPDATGQQGAEQPQQPMMQFTSTDGSFTVIPSAESVAKMQANPDLQEIYQKRVDLEGQLQSAKTEEEKRDLESSIAILNRLFNGQDNPDGGDILEDSQPPESDVNPSDGGVPTPSGTPTPDEPKNTEETPEAKEPPSDGGESPETTPETPSEPKPEEPKPEEPKPEEPKPEEPKPEEPKPEEPKPEEPKPEEKDGSPSDNPESPENKAPSDEEFQVSKNKYELGGNVYTDVSGKGLLRGMLSSFLAGLHGEGIITGWDRISGTWDSMKRSEAGERVRDGIASALIRDSIDKYANMEGLSNDAKMEMALIKDMMNQAKSPKEQMAAVTALQKWKEKYAKEIGEPLATTDKDFSELGQKNPEWKAPPTSIFPPVPADERDTTFMDTKGQQILDALDKAGVEVDILDKINGSSVVQFKVQRKKEGTDKALQDALKNLQSDLGITISYTPDTTSGALRTGTITVNNPKVKDASLRRLLEDENGINEAKKMDAPLLVGETADGKAVWCDAGEHGFLGGDSGGGKSERIIGMVSGAFSVKSPSELQVIFNAHANAADFEDFEEDPHTAGVGHNIEEVAENLMRANSEWKRRQKLFAEMGIRNLKDYNKKMEENGTPEKKLPQLLVITDEVTNLLAERPELADQIRGILTNGRKFGVCHVGATQDMNAKNMPTDIKGALRMGVKATKSQAAKAIFDVHTDELGKMNPKGDIMYRDKSGNLVRLRGTYADGETRAKLRDYNTGKITAPEEPKPEEPKPEEPKPEEPKPEEPKPEEKEKDTKTDGKKKTLDISSRENALASIKAMKDEAIAKADAALAKTGDLDKYEEALNKADEIERRQMNIVNRRFPEEEADGDSLDMPETGGDEKGGGSDSEGEKEEWESPFSAAQKPENRIKKAQKEYEEAAKAIDKDKTLTPSEKLDELQKLEDNYKKYVEQVNAGISERDILAERAKADEEVKAKNKEIKDKIPTKRKGKPIPGSEHILKSARGKAENIVKMPKALVSKIEGMIGKENGLPKGFEIDTDPSGHPLWIDGRYGFARSPETGIYGKVFADGHFSPSVDPTNPKYKGPDSPEAKAAYKAWMDNEDKSKDEQLAREFHLIERGVPTADEAPDNMEIVANAVAEALSRIDESGN